MKVMVTGATGFLGFHVARALADRGHFVSCLVRLGSERRLRLPKRGRSERVSGDLTDPETLERKALGCDAVVNLVGIVREDPRWGQTFQRVHVEGADNLVVACLDGEVRRIIHVSALGAAADASHPYRRTKFEGEEKIRQSPLRWTILRPSLVYGPGNPTVEWMVRLTYGAPLLPVAVPGRDTKISPLWVGDFADAVAACLERPETEGQTLNAAGPRAITVGEMVAALARARGVPHWQLPVSPSLVRGAARWLGLLPGVHPPAALDLLGTDHAADGEPFARATGVTPVDVDEGMRRLWALRRGVGS